MVIYNKNKYMCIHVFQQIYFILARFQILKMVHSQEGLKIRYKA